MHHSVLLSDFVVFLFTTFRSVSDINSIASNENIISSSIIGINRIEPVSEIYSIPSISSLSEVKNSVPNKLINDAITANYIPTRLFIFSLS